MTDPVKVVSDEFIHEAALKGIFDTFSARAGLIWIPIAIVGLIFTNMLWTTQWGYAALVWTLTIVLHSLGRWRIILWMRTRDSLNYDHRLWVLTVIHAISGILHALPFFLFLEFGDAQRAILTIFAVGLAIGNVGLSYGHPKIAWAYQTPLLGVAAFSWIYFAESTQAPTSARGLGVMLIALIFILGFLAQASFKQLKESVGNQQALLQLNSDLKQALDSAQTANRAKTRFLAAASHDLRQPLHTLAMFSAALQLRPLDEKSAMIATNIGQAMQDLSSELDSILDLSKLDAGIVQVNLVTLELNQMLESIRTIYAPLAQEKGLELWINCNAQIELQTDRTHLERILRNLIDNAIKYSSSGTISVDAKLAPTADTVVISVQDQGIGIDPEHYFVIFEEFYQVHNPGRNRSKGLGLGLSIVKRLTELLGIELSFKSELNRGTCFELTLPAARGIFTVSSTQPRRDFSQLFGLNVIVLDDEPTIIASMDALLTELGCKVRSASDQGTLASLIKQNEPEIVLADIRLQNNESGIDTVRWLKRHYPSIRTILISGDTEPAQLAFAQEVNVPLMHKPINFEALTDAMYLAIESRSLIPARSGPSAV